MNEYALANLAAQLELTTDAPPAADTRTAARSISKGPNGERLFRFRHSFKPRGAVEQAHCNVVIVETLNRSAVLVAECDDNPGCSVTNAYEHIAGEIHKAVLAHLPADRIAWFEFYRRGLPNSTPTLDHVVLEHHTDRGTTRYGDPKWIRITLEQPRRQGASR